MTETPRDRTVRLALAAGQRRVELARAQAEIDRLRALCAANEIDPRPPLHTITRAELDVMARGPRPRTIILDPTGGDA